jgi:hypothetical protein
MKKIIFLTAIAFTTMIIISCTYSATRNPLKDKKDTYKILYYASLAGSSHNSQPWKAEVFPNDSILIFVDTSRLLGVVDPKGNELFISVEAFIENFDIAANASGYKTEITLYDNGINSLLPVASIKLAKNGPAQNHGSLKELELRTTLRIPFDTIAIKSTDLEKLFFVSDGNIIFVPSSSPAPLIARPG